VTTRFGATRRATRTRHPARRGAVARLFAFDSTGKQLHQKIPGVSELYVLGGRPRPPASAHRRIQRRQPDERDRVRVRLARSSDGALGERAADSGECVRQIRHCVPSRRRASAACRRSRSGRLTGVRVYDPSNPFRFRRPDWLRRARRDRESHRPASDSVRSRRTRATRWMERRWRLVTPRGLRADFSAQSANRLDRVGRLWARASPSRRPWSSG